MRNEEILEKVKKNLKGLELIIKLQTGINCEGRLKVELEKNKKGSFSFRISSDSLRNQLDPLSRQIFEDIIFYFWGGTLIDEDTKIWFSPKVSYEHVKGGSNGCNIIWNNLWFDIETETWIPCK
tara:strand:- start:120 stop:491 length:372 start_codon:yes stop_codon:yes gene_type:complete